MSSKVTFFGITLAFAGLSYHATLLATQHALVVGINQYSASSGVTQSLKGAVNDATLIRDRLRDIQVQLPEERVLLDERATRAGVIQAWKQMVKGANPGDTLIFTYAGHGSQINDKDPLDEQDGKDETLVLYDAVIIDDELIQLFSDAKPFNIVFVADSCHSGGLKSKGESKMCRYAGEISSADQQTIVTNTNGDGKEQLTHVTFITAQQSDASPVCEITEMDRPHGALSWFFAKALQGEADAKNRNQELERFELEDYLKQNVSQRNGVQLPEVRPSDNRPVIALLGKKVTPPSLPPVSLNLPEVAIRVKNGSAPPGLKRYRLAQGNNFDLRFVVKAGEQVDVFYNTGDRVAVSLESQNATQWQRVIDKELLLQALATQFDMRLTPVRIHLTKGGYQQPARIDELHPEGELLNFSVSPKDQRGGLNALTLFNLAGNGELQFLYPLDRLNHSATLARFPYSLKPLEIMAPFGGDHLVAILCDQPPRELQKLLETQQSSIPEPGQVIAMLHQQRCQVGQYAFFSCGKGEEGCN